MAAAAAVGDSSAAIPLPVVAAAAAMPAPREALLLVLGRLEGARGVPPVQSNTASAFRT
jgi:hypothetical protein